MPPITAMAKGCSICEPAPKASASGIMPATVASAVIMMGRRRRSPARIMLSSAGMPSARNFWSASSSRMPFLATMPITMISPMNDERLKVVPVISSARNTPQVESSAEESTAIGAREIAEFEQQHHEHQHDRQHQHERQILERFLLLLVLAAVLHADAGRHVQVGDGLLHLGHAVAQVHVLEARGHLHVALQVLAADFGLAGDLGQRCERADGGGLPGSADQQRVADGVQRLARPLGETHANGVGAVVEHHRRRRRLALQHGAGIQLHFLRRESGARR